MSSLVLNLDPITQLTREQLPEKMQEYLENGSQLGWSINPQGKQNEAIAPILSFAKITVP